MAISKYPTNKQLRTASDNSKEVIASWLKANRKKASLSQGALADLAGVDRKTINRIENGHFSPNIDTMTRVALVLGKKIPQLI